MARESASMEGVIDSIIYKNEENGYTIASVLLDDGGTTTVLGNLPFLGAGEHISATGSYSIHPQHGPQFQVESYYREMPEEEEGIYAYLASRVIRGVGPKTAGLIVSRREGKEVYYKAADTAQCRTLHETIERIMEISCPK